MFPAKYKGKHDGKAKVSSAKHKGKYTANLMYLAKYKETQRER